MANDLERAVEILKNKGAAYRVLWDYYDGDQPLRYSTKRLRDIFDRLDTHFAMNWCSVVVNAVLDKLVLKRFVVSGDKAATKRLNDLWWETEMKLDDDEVHKAMLVTGEAYVIAGQDDEYGKESYQNDPRLCHLFYEPDHPRQKRMGAKWWRGDDGKVHLNLYYPGEIVYFATVRKVEKQSLTQVEAKAFEQVDWREHSYGEVPMFHFRRTRRAVRSEMGASVLDLQDAVNKLLADMMVAAEFGAFKQRYVISQMETKGQLKNAPNEIWDIPGGDGFGQDTQVGEFAETRLDNFMSQIEKLATAIAVITRTPRHYFFEKAGSNPSGEALMGLEAPLNAKAMRYVERLQMDWSGMAQFLLRLDGIEVERRAIQTIFQDPRTLQPMTQAQARNTNVAAGMPLRTVLWREGWSEEDIAQMEADRQDERAAQQESLAQALLAQQRQFDQGDTPQDDQEQDG